MPAQPASAADAAMPPPAADTAPAAAEPVPVPPAMAKRWLPVWTSSQAGSGATAIYWHDNVSARPQDACIGGELMASSIVQDSAPRAVLATLQDSRCGNSVLGPVDVQQVLHESADGASKVLLLHLKRPSSSSSSPDGSGLLATLLRAWLAPRCAVLQQSLRQDARGVHCLLFHSLPDEQAQQLMQQAAGGRQQEPALQMRQLSDPLQCHQLQQHPASTSSTISSKHTLQNGNSSRHSSGGHTNDTHAHCPQTPHQQQSLFTAAACSCLRLVSACFLSCVALTAWLLGCDLVHSSSGSRWPGCWWPPVLLHVCGGFTVSGLEGIDGEGSPTQTLVTSIVKVDLQGCLSGPSPPTAAACSSSSISRSSSSWLYRAAVWAGVVDAHLQQITSAVDVLKAELSGQLQQQRQPSTSQQQRASSAAVSFTGRRCRRASSSGGANRNAAALVQALLTGLVGLADSMLSPLTAWQQPLAAARRTSSISSSGGRRASGVLASLSAAGGAAGDDASQLVGLDAAGQPLLGFCNPAFWSPLHEPGCPDMFQVRGPTYLTDRAKVDAGRSAFTLHAVDLVTTPTAVQHLARFLPSVRRSRAASAFVINMLVPTAAEVLNLVMTFGSSQPWPPPAAPASSAASSNDSGSSSSGAGQRQDGGCDADGSASGFVHALQRFLAADDQQRSHMFKLIPHIEVGPWMLQGAVGSTPVIMGRKLQTTYHLTERYLEVDIDVTTCRTAGFIVQSIRGMTSSLVIDLAYLIEAQRPQELPEALIGAVRFSNLDMTATVPLDVSAEVPLWPAPWEGRAETGHQRQGDTDVDAPP